MPGTTDQAPTSAANRALPLAILPTLLLAVALTWASGEAAVRLLIAVDGAGLPSALWLKDVLALMILAPVLVVWRRWLVGSALIDASAGPHWGAPAAGLFWGLLAGLTPLALAWGLLAMSGEVRQPDGAPASGALIWVALSLPGALVIALVHGLVERLLVVRIVQVRAGLLGGPMLSVAASAFCFAGIQYLQGYDTGWHLINGLLFGALLGLLALGRGGLIAAVIAHASWSLAESLVFGDMLGLQVAAGAGPDSYASAWFGVSCLLVLVLVALRHRPLLWQANQG